jgi:hypothetical protein
MKAPIQEKLVSATSVGSAELTKLMDQYGCGPVPFTGTNDALYERHLVFDDVMEATTIGARERFEAFARSVRDILSQRWLHTEETYERENPKRVYYLSMEFLIGRSLANAVDPRQRCLQPDLDRRLRGERHEQHEVHDERSADDWHAPDFTARVEHVLHEELATMQQTLQVGVHAVTDADALMVSVTQLCEEVVPTMAWETVAPEVHKALQRFNV